MMFIKEMGFYIGPLFPGHTTKCWTLQVNKVLKEDLFFMELKSLGNSVDWQHLVNGT